MAQPLSPELYARNLTALRGRSGRTADRLAGLCPAGYDVALATTGAAVLVVDGRPIDSLRDPVGAARRGVREPAGSRMVVVGLGTGYLAEAVIASGSTVTAIVADPPEALVAAMSARDLTTLLAAVPVLLADEALDATAISALRTHGPLVISHAASVAASARLSSFLATWAAPGPVRRARVLVVGPFAGGSLEPARSVARAVAHYNVDLRFLDASAFGPGYDALRTVAVGEPGRAMFRNRLAMLVGDLVVEMAREWRPDLMFALAQAPLDVQALGRLRDLQVTTAFWFVENARVLTYWREVAQAYDWFYAIQPGGFLEQLASAGAPRPCYLPMACDPTRHVPLTLSTDERARYGAEVSFAGAPYLNRRRMFAALADLPLRLWGPEWAADRVLARFASADTRFDLDTMLRVFAGSSINLNLHSADHVDGLDPSPDYVNPRTFELAACGAFQLVDHRSPLADLFAGDEIATFDSLPALRAQIRHYLGRPEERLAMAARARTRACNDHTYVARMREVLSATLPARLAASALSGYRAPTLAEAIDGKAAEAGSLTLDEAVLRMVRELASTGTAA